MTEDLNLTDSGVENEPAEAPESKPKKRKIWLYAVIAAGVVLVLLIGFTLLFSSAGPRTAIANLFATETATSTVTLTPTLTSTATVTLTPTETVTPSPTIDETATAIYAEKTQVMEMTQTVRAATAEAMSARWATQTEEARCREWDEVTMSDVGRELCVYGTVLNAWFDYNQWAFFMTFGNEPEDLYMVVYNGYYFENVKGHCVAFIGEVNHLGNTPVFVINPNPSPDQLHYCPGQKP